MGVRGKGQGDITVEFKSKDNELTASFKKAEKGTKKTAKGARRARQSLNKMGAAGKKAWTEMAAKVGLVTAGIYAAVRAGKLLVDAAREGAAAIAIEQRIDRIKGAAEHVEALGRGLRDTLDLTSMQQATFLLERAGIAAEDFGTVGAWAMLEAERSGLSTKAVLDKVSQSFGTGRVSALKLGADVKNVTQAMAVMRHEVDAFGFTLDRSVRTKIDKLGAAYDNWISDYQAGVATLTASMMEGHEAAVLLFIPPADSPLENEIDKAAIALDQFLQKQQAIEDLTGKQIDELGIQEALLRSQLDTMLRTKMGATEYHRVLRSITAELGAAADNAHSVLVSTMGAALAGGGSQAAMEAAMAGAVGASLKGRKGRKGGRAAAAAKAADAARQGNVFGTGTFGGPGTRNSSQTAFFATGGGPDPDRNFLAADGADTFEKSRDAMNAIRDQMEGFTSGTVRMTDAVGDMWEALGNASGSRKALQVLRGFKVASLAILAIEAGVRAAFEWSSGFAALATYRYADAANHFMAATGFTAVAVGKGAQAVMAARGGGGGAAGPAGGAGGGSFQPPPDYARRARDERAKQITVNITGPALDSPQFRRTVTDAVRRGQQEGLSTSPAGMM
ncbi:hypothetical protein HN937_09390 [Candidatus Poribacteria bacterium]|jgi:hypothetical protein|nr:hypothetical protein [Candidatus Poribacteria bacterium]